MSWEYKSEELPSQASDEEKRLNALAADGWEPISIERGRARLRRNKPEQIASAGTFIPETNLPNSETLQPQETLQPHRGKRSAR